MRNFTMTVPLRFRHRLVGVTAGVLILGLAGSALGQAPMPPPEAAWRAWLEQRAALARRAPTAAYPAARAPNPASRDAAWMGYASSATSGESSPMPVPPGLYRYAPYAPYPGGVPPYGPFLVYPY